MNRPTICLAMIVKDEAHVIRRCLESVVAQIDSYLIHDTGSTDDTIAIIREVLCDVPGVVLETAMAGSWGGRPHHQRQPGRGPPRARAA